LEGKDGVSGDDGDKVPIDDPSVPSFFFFPVPNPRARSSGHGVFSVPLFVFENWRVQSQIRHVRAPAATRRSGSRCSTGQGWRARSHLPIDRSRQ
jgi:hypothetical protein